MAMFAAGLDHLDTMAVFAIAGGITVVSGALALVHPTMRAID